MDENLSSANELVERQVRLMQELAGSLERAQAALLNSDVAQLGDQTILQQRLCEELQQLAGKVALKPLFRAPLIPPAHHADNATLERFAQRQRSLLTELREIGRRVEGLNRDYSALLRRARRTVDIFCRVLASSGITYLPPAAPARSALRDSRE